MSAHRTAAATEAAAQRHADRAVDDRIKVNYSVRVVRTLLARGRITLDDLTAGLDELTAEESVAA